MFLVSKNTVIPFSFACLLQRKGGLRLVRDIAFTPLYFDKSEKPSAYIGGEAGEVYLMTLKNDLSPEKFLGCSWQSHKMYIILSSSLKRLFVLHIWLRMGPNAGDKINVIKGSCTFMTVLVPILVGHASIE